MFKALERLGYGLTIVLYDRDKNCAGAASDGAAHVICDIGIVRVSHKVGPDTLVCEVSERAGPEDIEHALLDLVLPKLLARDGGIVLHGGCVAPPDGPALCFIGLSGHGKSTLAASFRQRGWHLLADDSAQLEIRSGTVLAQGLCANPRLLSDSLARLFPQPVPSSPVASYLPKRRVQLHSEPAASAAICAILELAAPDPAVIEPRITRMTPSEACMALLSHGFAFDPDDRVEGIKRFRNATEIARLVPVFSLAHPHDYDRLPDVQDAILAVVQEFHKEPATS